MSVPPLFKFSKDSLFSIGLSAAENTFYQLSEKQLKNQITPPKNRKETEAPLPPCFLVKDKKTKGILTSPVSFDIMEEADFDVLYQEIIAHLNNKQIWIRDSYLVLSNKSTLKTRSINEHPKDDLFILKTFQCPDKRELENFRPEWYFITIPFFLSNLKEDKINLPGFSIINFQRKLVLIGGASYSGKLINRLLSIMNLGFIRTGK